MRTFLALSLNILDIDIEFLTGVQSSELLNTEIYLIHNLLERLAGTESFLPIGAVFLNKKPQKSNAGRTGILADLPSNW